MRRKRPKMTKKIRQNTSLTRRIDFKRIGMLVLGFVLILYITFFLATKINHGGMNWKNNLISSNYTRTDASYNVQQSGQDGSEQNYDEIEDQYLSEASIVDTMQEKNIVRIANEKTVRKKLTKASQGVQDEESGSDGTPHFGEKTQIQGDQIIISITDYEVLQRIVEAEATGLDEKSKILVANVLFNRLQSPDFPNTIEEIVFQTVNGVVQFQPVSDGRYDKVVVQDDTVEAVNKALSGVDYSQGALYFLARSGSRKSSITWFDTSLTWLFEYEGHEFYK